MLKTSRIITAICLWSLFAGWPTVAQSGPWTLEACINYALEKNISVQKAAVATQKTESYLEQSMATRLPSLNASARQNFSWDKQADAVTGDYGSLAGADNTTMSLSSSVNLFSGGKINAQIKQSQLQLNSSLLSAETVKESVGLNIMQLYLQVIYAKEQVTIAAKQLEATEKQLGLSEERVRLGDASKSDYLQIKSSLATDKLTLANAQSDLEMAKVDLMQMMELPVSQTFDVTDPIMAANIDKQLSPLVNDVLSLALATKPQIKNAALVTESAHLDQTIARAAYYPTLSLDGSLGTSYTGQATGYTFSQQLNNHFSPALGLTLSVPIFQKRQVKTSVAIARLATTDARLDEQNTRNQLRKEVEQACTDVVTSQIKYRAGAEQLSAIEESHNVSAEKFRLGLMNAVDYLFEKNNLEQAQSQYLQSKFNLLFAYKILDFYTGIPFTL